MASITPSLFGYYGNYGVPRSARLQQAVPFLGSRSSIFHLKLAISGRTSNATLSISERVQLAIRGAIGVIPVVGLALIPIDLVATLVDAVRHEIYRRSALRTCSKNTSNDLACCAD